MNKYEIDMVHGPLLKKIIQFAIPLMFSGVLQLLFNAADIVVVGRYAGPEAIGAVGSTNPVVNLLVNLFIGLSVGVNVLVARYRAMGADKDTRETVSTAIVTGFFLSIIVGIIGVTCSPTVLQWMGCPSDIIGKSSIYLRIYFSGLPAIALYNFGSAILRAIGDTRRPLIFLIVAGISNFLLNLFFVLVLHIDVAGVAIATIMAQCMSAFLVLYTLYKTEDSIHFDLRHILFNKGKLKQIIKLGLPAGLQGSVFSFSNIIIQSSVNSFGSIVVAGNAASNSIEGFIYQPMNAFYQACVTFTSQNYAVRDEKRVNRILLLCSICVLVTGLTIGGTFLIFDKHLLSIYTTSIPAIKAGQVRMSYMCLSFCLCGLMEVVCGSVRGLGYSTIPMVVAIFGACILRIIWLMTVFQMYRTIHSIYISYPISWIITILMHLTCFLILRKKAFQS